ncbi:MAG: DNA adenine methylase [Methylomicrobium sp.]|nr:DNA adenine methylase [Methylomicrobium sp.]
MGSKNRIAKDMLPIMLANRGPDQYWVEPFVGGANMIDKVGGNRIGADTNHYLIALLLEMQKPTFEAPYITREEYYKIKESRCEYPDWLVGFAGFQLSFGAKWFDSYSNNAMGYDYAMRAKRNVDRQAEKLDGIEFKVCDYRELDIPENSLIYCDPPYAGATKYKAVDEFDSVQFWDWCRDMICEGHDVFVSEYSAPDDFKSVWSKLIGNNMARGVNANKKTKLEKLFTFFV